jgi:peptide deformylase
MVEDYPELEGFKRVFVNPTIIEKSETKCTDGEGCLSIPGIREDVSRPDRILVRYQDENFEWKEEELYNYAARIVQHEYDHIEGKLFIDYLSPLRKRLLKSKLNAISVGKVNVDYRIKIAK